jgi:uncharacterized protein YbbC (DUF1343 family)
MSHLLTGVDVLAKDRFAALLGQRVGLVTNPTGLSSEGRSTIDLLHETREVHLTTLFGPEHGLRGEQDELVEDASDQKTGLPIYSLYGQRNKPTPEQMSLLDTLVFDIQDIGCRFYTYVSTLTKVLEAASEQSKRVVVLDRPNPITGTAAEGPLPDLDKLSFTACHPLPVRHGMTLGELARLIHAEREFACSLEVVACQRWQRSDWFDATGLLWTDPSPNMRSLSAALLYPGIGLLEFTNLSVGRGTDTPFEVIGAPYLDPLRFTRALNEAGLAGVRGYPVTFTPRASVFSGERCGGTRLLITDRDGADPVQLGITIAALLLRHFRDAWQPEKLMTLLANQSVYEAIAAGASVDTVRALWAGDLEKFQKRREHFLLYG